MPGSEPLDDFIAVGITECSYIDLDGITCYTLGFCDIWRTASRTKAG